MKLLFTYKALKSVVVVLLLILWVRFFNWDNIKSISLPWWWSLDKETTSEEDLNNANTDSTSFEVQAWTSENIDEYTIHFSFSWDLQFQKDKSYINLCNREESNHYISWDKNDWKFCEIVNWDWSSIISESNIIYQNTCEYVTLSWEFISWGILDLNCWYNDKNNAKEWEIFAVWNAFKIMESMSKKDNKIWYVDARQAYEINKRWNKTDKIKKDYVDKIKKIREVSESINWLTIKTQPSYNVNYSSPFKEILILYKNRYLAEFYARFLGKIFKEHIIILEELKTENYLLIYSKVVNYNIWSCSVALWVCPNASLYSYNNDLKSWEEKNRNYPFPSEIFMNPDNEVYTEVDVFILVNE